MVSCRPLVLAFGIAIGSHTAAAQEIPPKAPAASRAINLTPYVLMVAGNAADLWTTKAAFDRGAQEANSIMAGLSIGQIAVAKGATTAGMVILMRFLETHGHPRVAKVIGYVDAGATFTAAAHNHRVQR